MNQASKKLFFTQFPRCLVFTSDVRIYFPALLFIFNLIVLYNLKSLLLLLNQPRKNTTVCSSLQHPASSTLQLWFLLYRCLFEDVLCVCPLGCRTCTVSWVVRLEFPLFAERLVFPAQIRSRQLRPISLCTNSDFTPLTAIWKNLHLQDVTCLFRFQN